MTEPTKHTIHSVGERVEQIYTKIERENEKVLLFLTRKHVSAIAGFALLVVAVYIGARLF